MSRRSRQNQLPALAEKVAIASIKGERRIAQIAEQFEVHPNQVTTWKAQLECGIAERKTMIDRGNSLSVTKQTEAIGIARGTVC